MKLVGRLGRKIRSFKQTIGWPFKEVSFFWNKQILGIEIDSPPTFIVGCGHSGTSVLLAILGAHPRIYAVPYESYAFDKNNIEQLPQSLAKFDKLAIAAKKHRWVEKTPKHILEIGHILQKQSNAQIILAIRDGRDVAYSIKQRTGSLEAGIKKWRTENLYAKPYWNHPNVYVVHYEDIISDFEKTITGVLSFLGETYNPVVKNYWKTPKKFYSSVISKPKTVQGEDHGQYRNWQINQPLFDGRGRWKQLPTKELSYITETAASLLAELGYVEPDTIPDKESLSGSSRGATE